MIINDAVYGKFDINEPVLNELINSKPLQRLKGISQWGPPDEFYHMKGFSRYEHSIGVMLILRKLGASLDEQTAGLLHDASHTAFSHVIDWVIGDGAKEDYQDNTHEEFINKSGIPIILKKHGLNPERISNIDNYLLLDKSIPELCADRIDYSLREFECWSNPGITKECINDLKVHDKEIIFNTKKIARIFAQAYLKCQTGHWSETQTRIRYKLLAIALNKALNKGIITFKDFYNNDSYVINKINNAGNKEINEIFNTLRGKIKYKEDNEHPQLILGPKKFRYVDPGYIENGKLYKLSETDNEFKQLIDNERINSLKEVNVTII